MKISSSLIIIGGFVAAQDELEGRRFSDSLGDYGIDYAAYGNAYGNAYADAINNAYDYVADNSYDLFSSYENVEDNAGANFGDSSFENYYDNAQDAEFEANKSKSRPGPSTSTRGGPDGSTDFIACRVCDYLSLADCHASNTFEVCDNSDIGDYDHICQVTYRIDTHRRTHVWTGCSTYQSCHDNREQNFVGPNVIRHQCRPQSSIAQRFRGNPSVCTFCHKLAKTDGTHAFPLSATTIESTMSGGSAITFQDIIDDPAAFITDSSLEDGQAWN